MWLPGIEGFHPRFRVGELRVGAVAVLFDQPARGRQVLRRTVPGICSKPIPDRPNSRPRYIWDGGWLSKERQPDSKAENEEQQATSKHACRRSKLRDTLNGT